MAAKRKRKRMAKGSPAALAFGRRMKRLRAAKSGGTRKRRTPRKSTARKRTRRAAASTSARREPVATRARKRRKSTRRAAPVAKRRRRRASRAAAPRRKARRSSGGRAKFSVRGLPGQIIEGVKDASAVLGGKTFVRTIHARFFPNLGIKADGTTSPVLPLGLEIGLAIAAGVATEMFISREYGRFVLAGGLSAPIESFIKAANIPVISSALGDEGDLVLDNGRSVLTSRVGGYGPRSSLGRYGGLGDAGRGGRINNGGQPMLASLMDDTSSDGGSTGGF